MTSPDLRALNKAHFMHPFTDFAHFQEHGCDIIARSAGIHVEDDQGRRYLDGLGGLWCVNVGHGRQEIAAAMARQASQMAYYSAFNNLSNEPAILLAARLARLAPTGLQHVFYSCGGSTANDSAIRIAHYYFNQKGQPRKKKIIARRSGYHGTTYLSATLTGTNANQGFDVIDGLVTHIGEANCYRRPAGLDEAQYCDLLVEEFQRTVEHLGAERIAAFIAEPIMGAGGVLVAPSGYHRRIWEICRANEILYISDEVVTGFGRLGHYFASEAAFGLQPDIISIAKGLTSAYAPLGATLFSEAMYNIIGKPQAPGGVFSTGFTYAGHPVSCAAALANLDIMEREALCAHVRDVGPYFIAQLKSRLSRHEIVGDVRGSHFMVGIENVADRQTKALFPTEAEIAYRIARECQSRGLLVRPTRQVIILSPPLIWTKAVIDEAVDILDEAIAATVRTLYQDGFLR
jgi:adenosylmethionine-8-amino-7-oxononanoate aminotransferase